MMVALTKHARKRLRQRCGSKSRMQEEALRAFTFGTRASDAKGDLRIYLMNRSSAKIQAVSHLGFVWVFSGHLLVTVHRLPWDVRRSTMSPKKRGLTDRGRRDARCSRLKEARKRRRYFFGGARNRARADKPKRK